MLNLELTLDSLFGKVKIIKYQYMYRIIYDIKWG